MTRSESFGHCRRVLEDLGATAHDAGRVLLARDGLPADAEPRYTAWASSLPGCWVRVGTFGAQEAAETAARLRRDDWWKWVAVTTGERPTEVVA